MAVQSAVEHGGELNHCRQKLKEFRADWDVQLQLDFVAAVAAVARVALLKRRPTWLQTPRRHQHFEPDIDQVVGSTVGKDTVSRVWRKVKGDWDVWNGRSLSDAPIIRLILDGTVVRVRLDKKATSISLLVALGVRSDSQKVLLAIKKTWAAQVERSRGLCWIA